MTGLALTLAVVVGLAFVAACLAMPAVALVMLVTLPTTNLNLVVATQLGVSPYIPELGLAVLVLAVLVRRRLLRVAWSPVLLGVLVLFATFWIGAATSVDPVSSAAVMSDRGKDLLFFVIVLALMFAIRRVDVAPAAMVTAYAAIAALTAVHAFVLGSNGDLLGVSNVPILYDGAEYAPRHSGTSPDPNFWARQLILVLPLSMSLLAVTRRWVRLFWIACTVSIAVGIYLTQSRGGFLAVTLAVVVWLALAGGRYRKSLLLLPVAGAGLFFFTGIASRLSTLGDLGASSTATADLSVVTRARLQLDAWLMFLDDPLTGQGLGTYGSVFLRFDRLSNYYNPVDIVVAAHNFYLEQAADGGVVLLLGWTIFFGTVLFSAFRARALAGSRSPIGLTALGVVGGLVGWLGASVFLHLSDFRTLLVLCAIAATLDVCARAQGRAASVAPAAAAASTPKSRTRRPRRVAAGALAALSFAGAVACLVQPGPRYTGSANLAILPSATSPDGSNAYAIDLVSRGLIGPTFARVLEARVTAAALEASGPAGQEADLQVSVSPSRLGGGVALAVAGDDAEAVATATTRAVALSEQTIADLKTSYRLAGDSAGPPRPSSSGRWLAAPLGALGLLAGLVLLRTYRGVQVRDSRRDENNEQLSSF